MKKRNKTVKPLIISRTLPYLGGREIMVDQIINFFSNGGVAVLTPDKYPQKKGVALFSPKRSLQDIEKWVQEQDPTLINCHTFYLADVAVYIKNKFNIPLVFTLHGVFTKFYDKDYGDLLKKIYKHSDVVITVSENYKNELAVLLGSEVNILIVRNGVPFGKFDCLENNTRLYRDKHDLPQSKYVVVIPARLNHIKGLEYVVRASLDLPEILFVVCSPSGRKIFLEEKHKRELIFMAKGSSNVFFKRLNNDQMLEVISASDVVLLPSLIERISISILEAMALQRLVITTNVGGNPEIIRDGYNGFLINPRDTEAIKRVLKEVRHTDSGKIDRMIKNARSTVEKYFSAQMMLDKYEEVFLSTQKQYENK